MLYRVIIGHKIGDDDLLSCQLWLESFRQDIFDLVDGLLGSFCEGWGTPDLHHLRGAW